MELIRNRTLEIRRKEQKRRQRTQDFGCVAACVILIACLGILMPQVANQPAYAMDGFFAAPPVSLEITVHRGIS